MRKAINSAAYHVPLAGFSHLVEAPPMSRTLYLSGLTSRTDTGDIVAAGDLAGQVDQIFTKMSKILEEAGASLDDVVSIRSYVVDIEAFDKMAAVWQKRWGDAWPASTMVEVSRLWDKRQLIEIEAIAVVAP